MTRPLIVVLVAVVAVARSAPGQTVDPTPHVVERIGVDFTSNPPTFSPARPLPSSPFEPAVAAGSADQIHTTCPRPGPPADDPLAIYTSEDRSLFPRPIWFNNLALLAGFDGARGPDDLGINANVGGRIAVQTSFPLLESAGLAVQIGSALNYHNTATRFQRLNGGPHERTQSFTTLGIFQRTETGLVWGVAYDYLHSHAYANLDLGQWRGQAGYRFDADNEIGVWATYHDRGDSAQFAGERFNLRAINMANLYFTHFWEHNAMSRVWIGMANQHGRAILGIPGDTPIYNAFTYGAEFLVPLNSFVSLYAEANLITPLDSGCVNAFVGIAFYPGGRANEAPRGRFAPMFPLANNANFAIDASR